MVNPRPGDFGLTEIRGITGWLVGLGQFLNGDASIFSHAFVVLDDGTVMEAQPGGARITPLETYSRRPVAFSTHLATTEAQRDEIVRQARLLEGTPYSFLDYLALALTRLRVRPRWLRRYVASTGHMICSQLVDEAYRRAGVHLFTDGRLSQDVTPGDLANRLLIGIRESFRSNRSDVRSL